MRRIIGVLAAAWLLAACGTARNGPTTTLGSGVPMLTVVSEGGFVPLETIVGRGPRAVLMADGRLFFEGPSPAIFPGPMLTPSQVARLDDDTMRQIRRLVDRIGFSDLTEVRDTSAAGRVADATTEVVTYRDGRGAHVVAVYALGIAESGDPRVRLLAELVELLDDLAMSEPSEPAPVERMVVHVTEGAAPNPDFPDVRPWPLPLDPASLHDDRFPGWRCTTVTGDDLDRLLRIFSDASQATVWDRDGTTYRIVARPLLLGEAGC